MLHQLKIAKELLKGDKKKNTKDKMHQMYTKWGEELDCDQVLKEYPRPSMKRDSYLNMNGYWSYAITKESELPIAYQGEILVPFSPESVLSGVNRMLMPEEFLHYKKEINIEDIFPRERILLHFGAVDQICTVFVNGKKAGSHVGGYLPFSIDVTAFIVEKINTIQVVVKDYSDTSYHSVGKQKLKRGGMFYQAQSGIWQTVWMERVPKDYIKKLKITPHYDRGHVECRILHSAQLKVPVEYRVFEDNSCVAAGVCVSETTNRITIPKFVEWTPEKPFLYRMEIRMGEDRVETYFAMRKCSIEKDAKGILRFFLNNRPYFHNGLLDQGYWPDGLYTAPHDEALVYDIKTMKNLGYNMIRKHSKVEPERWYYHCDRLGMLVWQDMVNGGTPYNMKFVCVLPNVWMKAGRIIKDSCYKAFSRADQTGRDQYYKELKEMMVHLYHFPSIVAWVPFNEGWGQFDAKKATACIRKRDAYRLIDEASGWFDQGGGDMYSIHNYWRKLNVKPNEKRVVALTEYGGYSWAVKGHRFCDEVYGYRTYESKEALTAGYAGMFQEDVIENLEHGLSATVYTQVSDIEEEVNGLLTYDRKELKMEAKKVAELNKKLKEKFKQITSS